MPASIIIADTSVLLNFLRIDRMDLIGRYPGRFFATDHVGGEITDLAHQARYVAAISAGYVAEMRVDAATEVELFLRLDDGRLGAGERSAIAVALSRGCALAIDDNRAIGRALRELALASKALNIVRTPDIMVALIREGVLNIADADVIKGVWDSKYRFRLKFGSFRELI